MTLCALGFVSTLLATVLLGSRLRIWASAHCLFFFVAGCTAIEAAPMDEWAAAAPKGDRSLASPPYGGARIVALQATLENPGPEALWRIGNAANDPIYDVPLAANDEHYGQRAVRHLDEAPQTGYRVASQGSPRPFTLKGWFRGWLPLASALELGGLGFFVWEVMDALRIEGSIDSPRCSTVWAGATMQVCESGAALDATALEAVAKYENAASGPCGSGDCTALGMAAAAGRAARFLIGDDADNPIRFAVVSAPSGAQIQRLWRHLVLHRLAEESLSSEFESRGESTWAALPLTVGATPENVVQRSGEALDQEVEKIGYAETSDGVAAMVLRVGREATTVVVGHNVDLQRLAQTAATSLSRATSRPSWAATPAAAAPLVPRLFPHPNIVAPLQETLEEQEWRAFLNLCANRGDGRCVAPNGSVLFGDPTIQTRVHSIEIHGETLTVEIGDGALSDFVVVGGGTVVPIAPTSMNTMLLGTERGLLRDRLKAFRLWAKLESALVQTRNARRDVHGLPPLERIVFEWHGGNALWAFRYDEGAWKEEEPYGLLAAAEYGRVRTMDGDPELVLRELEKPFPTLKDLRNGQPQRFVMSGGDADFTVLHAKAVRLMEGAAPDEYSDLRRNFDVTLAMTPRHVPPGDVLVLEDVQIQRDTGWGESLGDLLEVSKAHERGFVRAVLTTFVRKLIAKSAHQLKKLQEIRFESGPATLRLFRGGSTDFYEWDPNTRSPQLFRPFDS